MNYEEAGIATMLAGLVRAREILDKEIEAMQGKLQLAQNGGGALEAVREAKQRGPYRPRAPLTVEREFKRKSRATSGWWANMTPEERSAEMKRRYASRKDRPPTGRPAGRGGDHYGKVSTGQAKYWAKMTPAERRAEMQRRAKVRQKKWAEAANVERLHPRDPRSPKHEAWLKTMSKAMKASHKKRRGDVVPAVKMQHVNGEAVA